MKQRLLNKKAAVTGASSGIGQATALCLAKEGADVALIARDMERLAKTAEQVRSLGRKAIVIQGDIKESSGETSRRRFGMLQGRATACTMADILRACGAACWRNPCGSLSPGRKKQAIAPLCRPLRHVSGRKNEETRKKITRLFANRELILIFVGKEIPIKQLST